MPCLITTGLSVSPTRTSFSTRRSAAAVPRFGQRLQRAPFGCGRPIWVDDAEFTVDRHLIDRTCLA
ncbi:wax ester/triacylglycerol synthase domain-containing protein [Nakamurella sp. UYEF19]|uniref:wax ester/triacylglycerol synthase domain-containing protein n=1 Tax=Nakamurella sp. UYEF19 TaxID=1756392 RepID=UPI00339612C5